MPTTILIVDDQEIVRKLVRVALNAVDAVFLEAKDAAEALKIASEHHEPIDLLVSDVVMPGKISGIEMAAQLSHTRPDTKVLLMSGFPSDVLTMRADWSFVQKPFGVSEIRNRIGDILTGNSVVAY